MINEVFRDVPGYEGLYKVSNYGEIYSVQRNGTKGGIMKTPVGKNGYLHVSLSKNNKFKSFDIHRLVALTFIPRPKELNIVNHKDENKLNNSVSNLEWCTAKYNNNYGTRNERMAKSRINKSKAKKVLQLSKNNQILKVWPSFSECQRQGLDRKAIWGCCVGRRKLYKQCKWSYERGKKENDK